MDTNPFNSALQRVSRAASRAAEKIHRFEGLEKLSSRETLRDLAERGLKGRKLVLASNREPYVHEWKGEETNWFRAAGGLTIALDSMAAACDASWVCHGSGNADFAVTDAHGRIRVPPNRPSYTLRRLPLTREEEQGYYDGFSNAALWPLCHVCFIRPKFILSDWQSYQAVNAKFAQAVADEAPPSSVVFLQDYHLALVGKMLKEIRPDLTSVLFWHIPWPNPEIFRVCPYKRELLEGLLGNDILGFHLRYHADNFMETVGLELESQLDWDRLQVQRGTSRTRVRSYPISVDFESIYRQAESAEVDEACADRKLEHHLKGLKVGLGVDRLDYTKGIPERLDALGRFFDLHPEWLGRFTYVQIGVPSRTHLEDYQNVVSDIERRCENLNARLAQGRWKPVILLLGHQNFDTLIPYYKLADVCMVSSLHDGMNLV
ncbi:MAG: alpha,alpha-trehalose-phosphate synthase (UDP-forming), partial [bacterium]